MQGIDPPMYSPAVAELLRLLPLAPLGPGHPVQEVRGKLEAVGASLLADGDMAAACRAGLWLAFDYLDESHAISQELHTVEGSFWHVLSLIPQTVTCE